MRTSSSIPKAGARVTGSDVMRFFAPSCRSSCRRLTARRPDVEGGDVVIPAAIHGKAGCADRPLYGSKRQLSPSMHSLMRALLADVSNGKEYFMSDGNAHKSRADPVTPLNVARNFLFYMSISPFEPEMIDHGFRDYDRYIYEI